MARPKAALVVTKVDRQVLDSMAQRARTAPQLVRRARIVALLHEDPPVAVGVNG